MDAHARFMLGPTHPEPGWAAGVSLAATGTASSGDSREHFHDPPLPRVNFG